MNSLKVSDVTATTTINPAFSFGATYGKFYSEKKNSPDFAPAGGDWPLTCQTPQEMTIRYPVIATSNYYFIQRPPESSVIIPSQTIPYTFTVVPTSYSTFTSTSTPPTNQPPTAPTISGPTTGTVSTSMAFGAVSTDPDNDQIRYGFDWNRDGTVDEWDPSSGYVDSGTSQNGSKSWSITGSQSFQVLAQDSKGATSTWSSYGVDISDPTCTNSATNYPTCTINPGGSCINGDINPPACTTPAPTACTNGATDPGTCIVCPTGQCLVNNVCTNGGANYCVAGNIVNTCGLVNQCLNGSSCSMVSGVATCVAPIVPPGNPVTMTLTSSPAHVQSGGKCTLSWNIQGASSCTLNGVGLINYGISLDSSGNGNGSMQGGSLNSSATYTLNCQNGTENSTKTASCSVIPTVIEN